MDGLDRKRLFDTLLFVVSFLAICWSVFLLNETFSLRLNQYGNGPWRVKGLIGIITSPFLHGDLNHIWGNTLSFFTLGSFLFFFYRKHAFKVLLWLILCSGVILWLIGVPGSNHIGASGVVYGLASFLFISGLINDNTVLLRVSMAVAFLYGSIVWGILPYDPRISWEGHLAGMLVGIALAIAYRGKAPKRQPYQYELDEIKEAEEAAEREMEIERLKALGLYPPSNENPPQHTGENNISINYIFEPK
ncbi:MAG: rhomboid family intramembrane serine protease, partial [Flavobacteriales bacterium]